MADLPKNADELNKLKESLDKYVASAKEAETVFGSAAISLAALGVTQEQYTDAVKKSQDGNDAALKSIQGAITLAGNLGNAFLSAAEGAKTYKEQFDALAKGADNAPGAGFIFNAIKGYDEATTITRKLKGAAIDVGTAFGESFSQIQPQFAAYASGVRLAQDYTYETRDAIEKQTKALASMGISMKEMTQTAYVGGTAQNMLSEGFLLSSQTGLSAETVFGKMATASRKMGVDTANAGQPLLDLQRIALNTGLPMDQLSDKIFGLAERYARFGMTVDNIGPIVKRFTDVLGSGFKGLAIEEVQNLVEGLGRQVNTTQAAFMAMQSGMARPGSGVAGAMLDFENAMAKPEEAMRMLASSLSGIGGGKIMKFEEARAGGEAAATQFKLQRDMLTQLTGINDPQQTRTLLAILADLQSGRQVTQEQKTTLESALKSGQQKQDEKASAQERLMKVLVGLFTDADMKLARLAETKLPSAQAQASLFSRGGEGIRDLLGNAEAIGSRVLDKLPDSVKALGEKGNAFLDKQLNAIEPGPEIRGGNRAPDIEPFYRPSAPIAPPPTPAGQTGQHGAATSATVAGKEVTNIVVTIRGTDDLTRTIAEGATVSYNKTLHGNG